MLHSLSVSQIENLDRLMNVIVWVMTDRRWFGFSQLCDLGQVSRSYYVSISLFAKKKRVKNHYLPQGLGRPRSYICSAQTRVDTWLVSRYLGSY